MGILRRVALALLPLRRRTRREQWEAKMIGLLPGSEWIPLQVRVSLLGHYERLLLTHPPFRAELLALCHQRANCPTPKDVFKVPLWMPLHACLALCEGDAPLEPLREKLSSDDWRPLFEFFRQVYRFCEHWKLPYDTAFSLLRLVFSPDGFVALGEAVESSKANYITDALERLELISDFPPDLPLYSPVQMTREQYRAIVLQRVDEYIERVEQRWRELGWRGEAFAHLRSDDYCQRLARQAFQRTILRWSWGQIHRALQAEGQYLESRTTIQRSTRRACQLLELGKLPRSLVYLSRSLAEPNR